jgi:hypothetical protein
VLIISTPFFIQKPMQEKKSIRVQNLSRILLSKYIPAEQINRKFSSLDLKSPFFEKLCLDTYENLGGQKKFPEINFDVPLLEFGRFCILLDEPIHFNRYRAKTLRSVFYDGLTSFPAIKYRTYCRKHEVECVKAGTSNPHWTNAEAEYHFGPSQQSGDLGLSGSAGWKMTAFKDFLTDMICRQRKIRLLRISVWDDLMINKNLKKFNELLISPGNSEAEQILKYVERKIVGLYADDF